MMKRERKREEIDREGDGEGAAEDAPRALRARLTLRDEEALRWLCSVRAANLPQLRILLGQLGDEGPITSRRTAQIVARWRSMGLAEKATIFHREPAVVWPTAQGARLCGVARWKKPAIGTLRHTLAVTQVRLQACRPSNGRGWLTESQLRALLGKDSHCPDGGLVEQSGEVTAIEVELTPHGRTRVREAIASLLAERDGDRNRFAKVLYLVSKSTKVQVEAVRDELPPHLRERVVVLPCPV